MTVNHNTAAAPARHALRILVVNQTAKFPVAHGEVASVVGSLRAQAHEFAGAWGLAVPTVEAAAASIVQAHADAKTVDLVIALLDNADQAGALGYHSEDANGVFYARVFVGTCKAAGVAWSSCASHELLEAIADLAVDRWAQAADGKMWAVEVCDPVESDVYTDAHLVELSSYVLPAYFDEAGVAPFDRLGRLTAPFSLGKGGYAVVAAGGRAHQVFGDKAHYDAVEGWRAPMKASELSRTARRLARPPD